MTDLILENEKLFENIKHIDDDGVEFWYARELQVVLEYTEWRNFENVIEKAKLSCKTAGSIEISHFVDVNKMVSSGVSVNIIPLKEGDVMKTAAAYIRVSTEDQTEHSPEAQLNELKLWGKRHDILVDPEHASIGAGVRTHRGNKFEGRTIEYILNSPMYCGFTRWTPTSIMSLL